jgi:hypothetical protein
VTEIHEEYTAVTKDGGLLQMGDDGWGDVRNDTVHGMSLDVVVMGFMVLWI